MQFVSLLLLAIHILVHVDSTLLLPTKSLLRRQLEITGTMSDPEKGGSVSPSRKEPLPPPPKFDPSTFVFNTESKVSSSVSTRSSKSALNSKISPGSSSSSVSSLVQSLPKPPPLPIKKSSYSFTTNLQSSALSSENPPFELEEDKNKSFSNIDGHKSKQEESEHVHQTVEDIPPLESAPPSGPVSLSPSTTTSEHGTELESKKDTNQHSPQEGGAFSARSWLPSRPISPSIPKSSSTISKVSSEDEQNQTTVKKVQQQNKYMAHPKYHLLSYSQRSIPIFIQATPSAEAVAAENNLTLSEMMNGLANSIPSQCPSLTGRLAPVRSISRMINFSWDMINFNFYSESDRGIRTCALNDTDNGQDQQWEHRFNYAAKPWPEDNDKSLANLEEDIEMHLMSNGKDKKNTSSPKTSFSNSKTSWLARFLNGVQQQTDHAFHSMIHCPLIVLYIATTSDGVKGLLNLTDKRRLPQEFQNGLFDHNGFKGQYLMLHDEIDGPKDWNEASTSEDLMRVFGNDTVSLIHINSQSEESHDSLRDKCKGAEAQEEDFIWDEFIPSPMPFENIYRSQLHKLRGTYLSEKDKLAVRRFISRMVIKAVIPTLERRIHHLNIEVTNNKKGVKNAFKSLWRKPRESDNLSQSVHGRDQLNSSNIVPYRFDTIENHTRLLADTLFLIRDYDSALSIYRLVKDDYRHDQQLMLSASVHEMMALCIYFTDLSTGNRSNKEIIQHIDSAIYLYTSAAAEANTRVLGNRPSEASLPTRCVTKLCLLLSTMRTLNQGREMETADIIASASSKETPLTGAVLLEQSAAYYFHAGMIRKYAFHMLMAGHMFRSAGQDYHAVRCFACSMYVLGFLFLFQNILLFIFLTLFKTFFEGIFIIVETGIGMNY